jgi:GTP-binding protein
MTNAKPKIAAYPFTTINPNLGVLKSDDKELVIADIPGLIEGAHEGVGLGIKFLKHIERTRLLIHMVDILSDNIEKDIQTIQAELSSYSLQLANKKRVLVFNKIDSVQQEVLADLQNKYPEAIFISAVSKQNIEELIIRLLKEA